MPIDNIALRKLLKLLYLPANKRRGKLRDEIRSQNQRDADPDAVGGGDFHVPFWSDAKLFVAGKADLLQSTGARVDMNNGRERLYPLLANGFLDWWRQETRSRNERIDFIQIQMKYHLCFAEIGATVKIDNIMTLAFETSGHMHIYPYFSEEPILSDEAAKLGLWAMNEAFSGEHADIRILDVLRGKVFRIADQRFRGDERARMLEMYRTLLSEFEALKVGY